MIFYKWSDKINYLILLIIGILIININSNNDYLHILSSVILIGATVGFTFRANKSFQFFIIVTSLSLMLVLSANYFNLKNFKNIDILSNSKDKFIEIIKEATNIPDDDKNELLNNLDGSLETVRDIIPFTYFLNSIFLSLCCFYFLRFIFIRRFDENVEKMAGIELFKLKDYLIFGLIAGWLTVLLINKNEYYFPYMIGLNVALILSVLYLIQAFGILKFTLIKKGLPTLIMPLSIFIILLFGIEYILFVLIILSGIGVIDFWVDFRKLDIKLENNEN